MMYVHGFMSGANGAKQKQLQKMFEGRYNVVAPELDGDPDKSLAILNDVIREEKPEVIIGTSLGGWMTVMCDSGDAKLIIVNPCTFPTDELDQFKNIPQKYFCKRLDGAKTYILTRETLDLYKKYDFEKTVVEKKDRIWALCSVYDELLRDNHISKLKDILPAQRLIIKDDFGHQCKDAGLHHLQHVIEYAISGYNGDYIDFYVDMYREKLNLSEAEIDAIKKELLTIDGIPELRWLMNYNPGK